jgi:hypothetical protein
MAATLVNPGNNYKIRVSFAFLWCLLFGCFYFMYKGCWGHAILAFILGCCTLGISWLIYPFFAEKAVIDHYLKLGYKVE